MFLCCCLKSKTEENLEESLIETDETKEDIHKTPKPKTALVKISEIPKVGRNEEQVNTPKMDKSVSLEDKIETWQSHNKETLKKEERLTKTDSKSTVAGVQPSYSSKFDVRRPAGPKENPQNLVCYKKSHLWNEPLKSDLIYFNLKNSSYTYISYRLTKNQEVRIANPLDYFLSKLSDKIHVIIGKQSMINAKLATLSKYNHTLIVANYGRRVTFEPNLQTAELIIMEDLRSIRWEGIDSLVVLTDSLHTYEEVKAYFSTVVKDLGWEELKKATFFFPAFMTLEDISILLFSCMSQYVMNASLEKASIDLAFEMELIECEGIDYCIIIKTRREEAKLGNSVYDHLKTSIALFGKDFCEENQRLFRDFYVRIREKSLKDYFGMKEIYKRNPSQFKTRIREVRDMDNNLFNDLEKSPSLKEVQCEDSGFYYTIQSKVREDIGRIFNIAELQKKEVDTPVKTEWDDEATESDFKTLKIWNKLDEVAKEELDQIDLDMGLVDDDEDDFYEKPKESDETDMVLKMLETDENNKKKETEAPTHQFIRKQQSQYKRFDHF